MIDAAVCELLTLLPTAAPPMLVGGAVVVEPLVGVEADNRANRMNDAAVDAMTILIGERIVKGKIMERQKALETYEQAKKGGKVAALLEQQRPNIFTQAVANITPNAEIKVTISFVETLKYADDTYEFRFPMTIGERYLSSSVNSDDAAIDVVP